MKMQWILKSVAVVLLVGLFLYIIGFMPFNIFPVFHPHVERVELQTYSHSYAPGNKQAQLSADEVWKAILLYNTAGYERQITGEPCCDTYWLEIYLTDGSMIRVAEGNQEKMIVTPVSGERFYITSRLLVDYVKNLIAKYDLVFD